MVAVEEKEVAKEGIGEKRKNKVWRWKKGMGEGTMV